MKEPRNYRKFLGIDRNKHISICVVSNKTNLKRDYSEFIDSCDLVIRSGKCCNINSGKAGSRIDIVFLPLFREYLQHTIERRHLKEIRERAKFILYEPFQQQAIENYCKQHGLDNITKIPFPYVATVKNKVTSICKVVSFALFHFSNSTVYFLGDSIANVRTGRCYWHDLKQDTNFFNEQIKTKRLISILEDDKEDCDCIYSELIK